MAEVREVRLPGVGVRHEFTTTEGEQVVVLSHRGGRRELLVYDRDDPDTCTTALHLSEDDTRTLAELLGAIQVSESLAEVQQQVEGLAIDWLAVPKGSRIAGTTIGDARLRTRTGVSIVAVLRGEDTLPAPGPEHRFEEGDVAVAVGTPDGLAKVRDLLRA